MARFDRTRRTLCSKLCISIRFKRGLFYKIEFKTPVSQGKTLKFVVEASFIQSLKLYPSEITQYEKQYVLYTGNSYYYSLYATKSQVAKFNLETDKVESFTQVKPTSKTDRTITYGPYENLKQFEQVRLTPHSFDRLAFFFCKVFSVLFFRMKSRSTMKTIHHFWPWATLCVWSKCPTGATSPSKRSSTCITRVPNSRAHFIVLTTWNVLAVCHPSNHSR